VNIRHLIALLKYTMLSRFASTHGRSGSLPTNDSVLAGELAQHQRKGPCHGCVSDIVKHSAADRARSKSVSLESSFTGQAPLSDGDANARPRRQSILRRASVSIKGMIAWRASAMDKPVSARRNSSVNTDAVLFEESGDEAENSTCLSHVSAQHTTALGRLRRAASFRFRASQNQSLQSAPDEPIPTVPSIYDFSSPIPGVGGEPPIIPYKTGGQSAKMSAALDNEAVALAATRHNVSLSTAFSKWLASN